MGRFIKELHGVIELELFRANVPLNISQTIALKWLAERDGRPQVDLALITHRDKTTLTRLLGTMEKRDLIYRKKCNTDRRVNRVYLTSHGRALIHSALPIVERIVDRALADVSADQIKSAKEALYTMHSNLKQNYE